MIGWAAGIFEGEGCINVRAPQGTKAGQIRLSVSMTDEDTVRKFHSVVRVGSVNGPYDNGPGRKKFWRWDAANYEAVQHVLASFWFFFGSRRKERARQAFDKLSTFKGGSRGEAHAHAKLTADKVRTIRSSPMSGYQLAKTFGVTQSVISAVRQGKAWTHVS